MLCRPDRNPESSCRLTLFHSSIVFTQILSPAQHWHCYKSLPLLHSHERCINTEGSSSQDCRNLPQISCCIKVPMIPTLLNPTVTSQSSFSLTEQSHSFDIVVHFLLQGSSLGVPPASLARLLFRLLSIILQLLNVVPQHPETCRSCLFSTALTSMAISLVSLFEMLCVQWMIPCTYHFLLPGDLPSLLHPQPPQHSSLISHLLQVFA